MFVVLVAADDRRHRQERLEHVAHRDRPAARAAAAVRLRERLVQVDVHDVEAHVARPRDAADGVEVRAVVVHERAGAVEDLGDLLDVLVEEAERRRVRQHQRRRVLVDATAQVVDVDVAARIRLHRRHLVARHRHRRRVRAVRGVGDDDLAPLLRLAAVLEVRAHEHQPRRARPASRRPAAARPRARPGHLARGSPAGATRARARPARRPRPAADGGSRSRAAPTRRSLTRGLYFIVQEPSG